MSTPSVKDPVCGKWMEWEHAVGVLRYRGKLYYFCCKRCLEAFRQAPIRFADQFETTTCSDVPANARRTTIKGG